MAKFNTTRRITKKHSAKTTKTPKLPVEKLDKIQTVQKLVSNEALRTSKYHNKVKSNIRRRINLVEPIIRRNS